MAYAVLGGSLLCAVLGAVAGFALSDLSHSSANLSRTAAAGGAMIGLLIGACVGVFFGSFAEAMDEVIRGLLRRIPRS